MDHRRALRFLTGVIGSRDDRPGRPIELNLSSGPIPADLYRPTARPWGTVIALHGLSLRAQRDPRLIATCRALASTGLQVVAPRIESLATLSVTPEASARIREVVYAVLGSKEVGRPDAVGLLGASFSGGQALAAAAHPQIRDRIAALLLVGAYADARTVLRHALGSPAAHSHIRLLVLRRFLSEIGEDRLRDVIDVALADESLRRDRPMLPAVLAGLDAERHARFLALRDDPEVGSGTADRILAEQPEAVKALSVAGSVPQVAAPITLVHGQRDSVVPTSESRRIQRLLQASGRPCRLCTTRLLDHGDIAHTILEVPAVIRVFGHWLATLDRAFRSGPPRKGGYR